MNTSLSSVESSVKHHATLLARVTKTLHAHDKRLLEMHYHLEELDNRGQRRNLRIISITEDVDAANLEHIVMGILNKLLAVQEDSPVTFERVHISW